jgi:tetratricopeptide (TPR) repeat protein
MPKKVTRAVLVTALLTFTPTISLTISATSFAAGTATITNAPDLTSVRAKIKAKDFQSALAELKPMLVTHEHADIYNFYAFALRKTGDLKQAATYYAKALDYDANHLGALEYQGEMFVELGQLDKAKANLARLVTLCPTGCEEREDLEQAIKTAAKI